KLDGTGVFRRGTLFLLILGYILLTTSWVFSNPPFASPDEPHHYVRAIAMGRGHPLGLRAYYVDPGLTPIQRHWVEQAVRSHRIPQRLVPDGYTCQTGHPDVSASCSRRTGPLGSGTVVEVTPVGTYQPEGYVLPGLLMRFGWNPASANILGRIGAALSAMALLAWAITLLGCGANHVGSALSGLLVAVTPMVVFTGATVSPSGIEIMSAVAFVAALIRLTRTAKFTSYTALAVVSTGSILALSRSLGPLWVTLHLAIFVLLTGPRLAARLFLRDRKGLIATSGLMLAMVLNRVWELEYGPTVSFRIETLASILDGFAHLPNIITQQIGNFGWLDTPMPSLCYVLWRGMIWTMVIITLLVANRSERRIFGLYLSLAAVVPVFLHVTYAVHTGFYVQGRHVLPLSVGIPIYAGEIIRRHRSQLAFISPLTLIRMIAPAVALVHALGWYANARRSAVGAHGPIAFFRGHGWSPVGGWWLWISVTALGTLLLASTGISRRSLDACRTRAHPAEPNDAYKSAIARAPFAEGEVPM